MKTRKKRTHGFTLVELIVVIVILAILATIAFLSFSNQSSSARDSTRLSDVSNIVKGLLIFNVEGGVYPIPDESVNIMSGITQLGYQGEAGANVLKMVGFSAGGGRDPLDNVYYTYNTNHVRNKAQLLCFLENNNNMTFNPFANVQDVFATDYTNRYPYEKGDQLGIILNKTSATAGNNSGSVVYTPIQDIMATGSGIDIKATSSSGMIVIIDNSIMTAPKVAETVFVGYTTSTGVTTSSGSVGGGGSGINGLCGSANWQSLANNSTITGTIACSIGTLSGTVIGTGPWSWMCAGNSGGSNANCFANKTPTGSYSWTKTIGGTGNEYGQYTATDLSGNVFVTGFFFGTVDFDSSTGVDSKISSGSYDTFITKFNLDGSYGWTRTMGGTGVDYGYSLATDSNGNIYAVGSFSQIADFNTNGGHDMKTSAGGHDIYITKINADGSYGWTKTMGGANDDFGYSVAVDKNNNVFITGEYSLGFDFDSSIGVDNKTNAGNFDIFITKIESNGSYGWTKTIGGGGNDSNLNVTTDLNSNIYVTGYFYGALDFDPSTSVDSRTSAGAGDIYITKINENGTYGWTKTMGGSALDRGYSSKIDALGNIYVTGYYSTTVDFDTSTGVDNKASTGNYDIFLTKINSDLSYGWTRTIGGGSNDTGYSVTTDLSNNVFVTGFFTGTNIDFDSGTGTDLITSSSSGMGENAIIMKINADGTYGWTKSFGARFGNSITTDTVGNIYVTGNFSGTADFDPTAATDNRTSAGSYDVFLTKIN